MSRLANMDPFDTIPVVQVDLEGNFLEEYLSINDAATKLMCTQAHITNALYGKTMSCYKKWFFVDKALYNPEKNYSLKYRKQLRKFKKGRV